MPHGNNNPAMEMAAAMKEVTVLPQGFRRSPLRVRAWWARNGGPHTLAAELREGTGGAAAARAAGSGRRAAGGGQRAAGSGGDADVRMNKGVLQNGGPLPSG